MITKEQYNFIAKKNGEYASWAIWANEEITPKSNIGDLSIFDLDKNPNLLETLNPDVIMVGLNFSRSMAGETFANFHDKRPKVGSWLTGNRGIRLMVFPASFTHSRFETISNYM